MARSKMPARERSEVEGLEVDLLLEGLFRRYGTDFRHYARASLRRRLGNLMREDGLESISALQGKAFHEPDYIDRVVLQLSVNVTTMFRDPTFFKTFREKVVPH